MLSILLQERPVSEWADLWCVAVFVLGQSGSGSVEDIIYVRIVRPVIPGRMEVCMSLVILPPAAGRAYRDTLILTSCCVSPLPLY